jgi:anti-anti-sigma factor
MHIQKDMTIYTAAELKPLILGSLKESATQQIDLSGVAEMDSAGLQLLLVARREAATMRCNLQFVNPSPAVAEVLTLVGLEGEFIARESVVAATTENAMTEKHEVPHES